MPENQDLVTVVVRDGESTCFFHFNRSQWVCTSRSGPLAVVSYHNSPRADPGTRVSKVP